MSTHRTAWHFFFAILLRKRGPRWIEVRDEVPLSDEPLRVDYLLLRRVPEIPRDDPGQTLRALWPLLPPTTIAELKTVGRPYRARNLDRLFGYLHLYFSAEDGGNALAPADANGPAEPARGGRRARAVERSRDLAGLLIVPSRTPTLEQEIQERGLTWRDMGGGYAELTGGLFRVVVVEIDVVAEADDDDVLRLFGHETEHTLEARRFWSEQVGSEEARMRVEDLEGFQEVARRFLDIMKPAQRVEGLAPEERVAGLAPEQVVRAVGADQLLAAMPEETLRELSDDFIEKLPEPARSTIRKRLGR